MTQELANSTMSRDLEHTNSENPLGGRYKIISELGAGGFGQTFLALDLHLPGRPQCVVKQLKPQTSDTLSLAMARRLFDTEAEVLYQLGNHDQIPRLLAHFEDNQEFYLAQELIDGSPLTAELVGQPAWSESRAIALLQDILQVLAFVHQQQVIHRDIKPPNLIRRHCDGKIVLIDFGAVKQVSAQVVELGTEQTNLTISIGTQGYMPNEQLAGNPRFSSDVYAVGMLGIQAVTGVRPKRLKEDPKTGEINWREHGTHISSALADILDQMVRYDFRERYPTAVEALWALQSLAAPLVDSLPQSQPQVLSEVREVTSSEELQPLSSTDEAPEIGVGLSPTNIWLSTEPPVDTTTNVGSTEQTEPLPQQEPPQSSEISAPTNTKPERTQKQFVQFWPVLAVLAAVGGTFLITKTLLSPQLDGQSRVPTASPTPSPVKTPKPTAAQLLSQADRLRKDGQHQKALLLYDKAIALKPDLAQAYWGRCYSLNKLQKPDEALVACNDALDFNPKYAEALWSKGHAFDQQKLPLEALQLYERATKLKPDFTEAWVDYGVALQGFGRSSEAIDALDQAIALNRNSAKAWSTKGEALWNLGRFDEAIPSLNKALQIKPNQPEVIKLRNKIQKELAREETGG